MNSTHAKPRSPSSSFSLRQLIVPVGTAALLAVIATTPWGRVWESWTVDFRYRVFNRANAASQNVVVIDIDDASVKGLEKFYGRWPFPRRIYKDLLEFVALGNPKAVLFDILFTGDDKSGQDDQWLGKISHQLGGVSHALHLLEQPSEDGMEFRSLPADWKRRFEIPTRWNTGARSAFADFAEPSAGILQQTPLLHVVTFPTDRDGVLRRAPLVFDYHGVTLPSLAMRGFLSQFQDPALQLEDGVCRIYDRGALVATLPLDGRGYLPIHYYRIGNEPKTLSIANVLASARILQTGDEKAMERMAVLPTAFEGKTVVIGASAAALHDLKATSLHPALPGAIVQATVLSNLIEKDFPRSAGTIGNWLIALALFAACSLVVSRAKQVMHKAIGAAAIALLYLGVSFACFRYSSFALPLLLPLLAMSVAVLDGLVFSVLFEMRQKKKAQATLAKYLAPSVAKQLIEEGIDPQAEVGRQAELTILFSDIRGFTSISEKFPPEEVVAHLNQYLGAMTDCIFDEKGTLDKFIGDAVMAFWGAPLQNEKHAVTAVRAALSMRRALAALQAKWGTTFTFDNGIGINTGVCIVGNIGSEKKLDYTVIGDNVNLASRIEGLTKEYCSPILIGENTYAHVKDVFGCRIADRVRVKGKERYVTIYQPVAEKDGQDWTKMSPVIQRYEAAWQAADSGDFKAAQRLFGELASAGDKLSEVHLRRLKADARGDKESA